MKQPKTYPNIDMIQTGLKLKMYIDNSGMSVKDIQEYLHLSCPQPVYRWIKGKSELFGTHMEELLVKKQNGASTELVFCADKSFGDRIIFYYRKLSEIAA